MIIFTQEEASVVRYLANEPKSVGEAISWEMSERDKLHDAYHVVSIRKKISGIYHSELQWEEIHRAILDGEIKVVT